MDTHYTISLVDGYVQVILEGNEDFEVASRLWPEVKAFCKEKDCFKVLGIANTVSPLSVLDSYRHAELFRELGITNQYTIAWVELNADAFKATSFAETVLSNRGFPGRVFSDEKEAMNWLLNQ